MQCRRRRAAAFHQPRRSRSSPGTGCASAASACGAARRRRRRGADRARERDGQGHAPHRDQDPRDPRRGACAAEHHQAASQSGARDIPLSAKGGPRRRRAPARAAAHGAHNDPARLLGARPGGPDCARRNSWSAGWRAGCARWRWRGCAATGTPRSPRPAWSDPAARCRAERAALICGRLRPTALTARRRIVAHGGQRRDRHERDRGGPRHGPPGRGHDRLPPRA